MPMRLIRECYASEIIGVAELRDRHAERSPLFPRCVEREIDLARERLVGALDLLPPFVAEVGTGPVTGWVEILTGRKPRGFDAFAREHADRFRGPTAA